MAKGISTWALAHMTWDYIQRMQEDIERMERTIETYRVKDNA